MSDKESDGRQVNDYISLHTLAKEIEKGGWRDAQYLADQLRRYPDVITSARSEFLGKRSNKSR